MTTSSHESQRDKENRDTEENQENHKETNQRSECNYETITNDFNLRVKS